MRSKQPTKSKERELKSRAMKVPSGAKTGVQGKIWGKQNSDWIPSLLLNPVRS